MKELELIAVDVDFGSFEIALAPDIIQKGNIFFSDFAMELKSSSFKSYKELLSGDFRDQKYISKIGKKYTDEERWKIYKPIFNLTNPSYKVNLKENSGKVIRTIVKPSKEKQQFYLVPNASKASTEENVSKTVLVYADVSKVDDEIKFNKGNIKKIHYFEELEYDTYPFTPIEIIFDSFEVEFHEKLNCEVSYKESIYFIKNQLLNITSSGDTREAAEEAFKFNIYSLYKNIFNEDESSLSSDAIKLKALLFRITKKYAF